MFVTNLSNTSTDFDGNYSADESDYNVLYNNVGVSLAPTTLEFGDSVYEVTRVETSPGSGEYIHELRGFIEGTQLADNLDVFSEAEGDHTALNKTIETEVTDGVLDIVFKQEVRNGMISGIVIKEK